VHKLNSFFIDHLRIKKKAGLKNSFLIIITIVSYVALFGTYASVSAQDNLPVIGVLGLANNGGLHTDTVDSICNRISDLIEKTQKFYVLKREFIPPVLHEQGMTINNTTCSQKEGLFAAGNLLSADQMIGGTISKKEGKLSIDLLRVNVLNRITLASQQISTKSSFKELIDLELPVIIEALLYDEKSINGPSTTALNSDIKGEMVPSENNQIIREKRKRRGPLWFIMSGILLAGGAAGAYIYHEKVGANPGTPDVPLSDLPVRTR